MARLPNNSTKAERLELHRAKMAGKKFDAARRQVGITPSMSRELTIQNLKKSRQIAAKLAKAGIQV